MRIRVGQAAPGENRTRFFWLLHFLSPRAKNRLTKDRNVNIGTYSTNRNSGVERPYDVFLRSPIATNAIFYRFALVPGTARVGTFGVSG